MSYAVIYIIISAIAGGTTPVFSKLSLAGFPPMTALAIRFFFATIVLLPFMPREAISFTMLKKNWQAATIGSLNPILFFVGLPFIQSSVTPLIYGLIPLFTVVYNRFVLGIHLPIKKFIGLIIGFIGVSSIVVLPLLEGNVELSSIKGNIFLVVAALVFTIYAFMSKRLQEKEHISPLVITFYFSLITLFIALALAIFEVAKQPMARENITAWAFLSAVGSGIIGTSLFYVTYQQALKYSSELTASLFTYLQPISTILLALIFLNEQITPLFICGGLLSIIGAGLVTRK